MNDDINVSEIRSAKIGRPKLPTPSGSNLTAPIADAGDEAVRIASENAGLVIVGGLAIGLIAAALMPRSKKKKLAKRSKKISALVSELSQALASQASDAASESRDKLGPVGKSVGETVSEHTKGVRKQAGQMASDAADQLNDSGKAIARKFVKLIEKTRG